MPFRIGGWLRYVEPALVTDAVYRMCVRASTTPAPGVREALEHALSLHPFGPAALSLQIIIENIAAAAHRDVPLCQDTGIPVFFVRLGNEVAIAGGTLEQAVSSGVSRACSEGYLRPSLVSDPAGSRSNTMDSTPPVIHIETQQGEGIALEMLLRGAGAENASRLGMLPPHSGENGVSRFVLETVSAGGASACPPLFVGIGIGGDIEGCAILAKKSLLRPLGSRSPRGRLAALEERLLAEINGLGIGPQGFGGPVTALDVRIESAPCHMASLPVCVCTGCHALRTAAEEVG